MVGGLTTEEIARAFVVPTPTMAQRITRAKKALAGRRRAVRGAGRRRAGRAARRRCSRSVYLLFNEGYTATAGATWTRPELCDEAMRLGRMLVRPGARRAGGARAGRPDGDPGVAAARPGSDADGAPVTLLDQDRAPLGPAADHARAGLPGRAAGARRARAVRAAGARSRPVMHVPHGRGHRLDRDRALYGELVDLTGSPIVELNRAVAVSMADGPQAGLAIVDTLVDVPALQRLSPAAERARRPAGQARAVTARHAPSSNGPRA